MVVDSETRLGGLAVESTQCEKWSTAAGRSILLGYHSGWQRRHLAGQGHGILATRTHLMKTKTYHFPLPFCSRCHSRALKRADGWVTKGDSSECDRSGWKAVRKNQSADRGKHMVSHHLTSQTKETNAWTAQRCQKGSRRRQMTDDNEDKIHIWWNARADEHWKRRIFVKCKITKRGKRNENGNNGSFFLLSFSSNFWFTLLDCDAVYYLVASSALEMNVLHKSFCTMRRGGLAGEGWGDFWCANKTRM